MDKELKKLKETICLGCPMHTCGETMNDCTICYCDLRESFSEVENAYKNIKKDLAGRQKKIESLMIDFSGVRASRDYYKENYEVECAKNRNLYAKYISAVRENADLKIKLGVDEVKVNKKEENTEKWDPMIQQRCIERLTAKYGPDHRLVQMVKSLDTSSWT